MNESEDLFRLLTIERQERQRSQLLQSLGYLNPSAEDFGLNKWTQLLYTERSSEDYEIQEFDEREPDHLVSVVAVPQSFSELEFDVESQAFRDWLSSLKWDYCPMLEAPFRHSRVQACNEGILLPVWFNNETRSVLERFLIIHRDGVAEFGLGKEVFFERQALVVFRLIPIVARIWQFLGLYAELLGRLPEEEQRGVTYSVNIRGTKNAFLGDLAEGWQEPRLGFPGGYNPRCPDKHLQFTKVVDAVSPEWNAETLARWFATRIDNAWGHFEPRCYVHANVEESQPFARRTLRR